MATTPQAARARPDHITWTTRTTLLHGTHGGCSHRRMRRSTASLRPMAPHRSLAGASRRSRRTCSPSSSARSPTRRRPGIDVITLGHRRPGHADLSAHRRGDAGRGRRPVDAPVPVESRPRRVPRGVRALLRPPLRRRDRPGDRGDPRDRRQGVHLQPLLRLPRPGGRRARVGPRATRSTPAGRSWPGPRPCVLPLVPELGFAPDLDAIDPLAWSNAPAAVPELPEQPDRRGRARGPVRAGGRARAPARGARRPRQRLLGDDLRRLRRAELPRDARARRRSGSRSSRSPRAST